MVVSVTSVYRQKQKNSHSCQKEEQQQSCHGLHHHHYTSLLSFLLFLLFLASCTSGAHAQRRGSGTFPLLASIPETAFRCGGRNAGYYADVEAGCQVYHMCDTLEKQFSYLCPNYTLFNQKFMICDHWYMVNCTMSHSYYELNDHIGEVPDKEANMINKGNSQGIRKATILTQKTQGINPFKAIVPVSMRKFTSTTKTTQFQSGRPTVRPANVFQSSFSTRPKNPFTTKSIRKTTTRPPITQKPLFTTRRFISTTPRPLNPFTTRKPPITQKPLFTTRRFISTTPRPLNPFSNSKFTLPQSSVTPFNFRSVTTSKPARASAFRFNSNLLTSSTTPKPARTFVFNRNTLTSSITPKPARASVFNRNTLISSSTPKPATASVFNRNTLTTPTRPITVTTRKPFTSKLPGNVARKPGGSFSFVQMKLNNLTITRPQLDGVVFRPIVSNSFAIKNRSSIPSFTISSTSKPLNSNLKAHPLVTTPQSSINESDEDEDQTSQHSTQQVLAAPLRALAIPSQSLGIPVPSRLLVPPPFNFFSNNNLTGHITTIIEPPTARRKGTSLTKLPQSVITNPQVVNQATPGQETPLTPFTMKPTVFRPFGISEGVIPGVLHVSFQSARGNRDFFIPSSGLSLPDETLPAPPNSLSADQDKHDHDQSDNAQHTDHGIHRIGDLHMTMLFPGFSGTPVISGLVLNPQCPHCHPAFLRPGQCTPCVRIRR
ncbi:unnamed protein product [Meganyctiphanes norvegica]|uniref:Chitin-binding type-2 domain-containing protein n=1 Tax=Meganyctiphanes norvegica TaxID=48144 RepID=A0AAV2Q4P7_MEGNR